MKDVKVWTIGALSVVAWIADWFFLKQVIYRDQTVSLIVAVILATIFGITFLVFFLIINKNRTVSLVLDFLIFIGYLVIMPKDLYVFLGGTIFFGLLFLFERRLAVEEKSRHDFSLRRVMSGSISVAIYALLLLIGFNVYHSIQADFEAHPDAYYQRFGAAAVKAVPYFTRVLPADVDMNQTFDEFAAQQAGSNNPSVVNEYKQEFFNQFEVSASGNQTMSDVFAQVVVDKIRQTTAGYEQYFPFIFAILVTTLLWTFAFVVRWATSAVGWVIFRLLLWLEFFKLEKVQVEVEKLII